MVEIKKDKFDIKRALSGKGMTQIDMAREMDITPESLSRKLSEMKFTKAEWKFVKEMLDIEED